MNRDQERQISEQLEPMKTNCEVHDTGRWTQREIDVQRHGNHMWHTEEDTDEQLSVMQEKEYVQRHGGDSWNRQRAEVHHEQIWPRNDQTWSPGKYV